MAAVKAALSEIVSRMSAGDRSGVTIQSMVVREEADIERLSQRMAFLLYARG